MYRRHNLCLMPDGDIGTAHFEARAQKFGKGPKMTEITHSGSGTFRKVALVLMICLIAFGVLELANVIKI
jgi:hypothetical protein